MGNFQNPQINSPLCSKEMYKTRQNEWKVYFNRYWEAPKHNTEKVISLQTVNEKKWQTVSKLKKFSQTFSLPSCSFPGSAASLPFFSLRFFPSFIFLPSSFWTPPFPTVGSLPHLPPLIDSSGPEIPIKVLVLKAPLKTKSTGRGEPCIVYVPQTKTELKATAKQYLV